MNRALFFLWLALLKRGAWHFLGKLRRPSTALGFAAVVFSFCVLFHYRRADFFREIVRPEILVGCALVMLGGSFFKGFLQRGLVFELPDIEFLFTGPFTRRQIVFYRLLPGYLYAAAQAAAFVALFAPHLKRPVLMFVCLGLFQIVCFHAAAGAAIFGGTLTERTHDRIRWMMLAFFAWITVIYFRIAWDLKPAISFVTAPLAQVFFYPALNTSDLAAAPWVAQWAMYLAESRHVRIAEFLTPMLYGLAFASAALISLWLLLKMKGDLFEPSLATSGRAAATRVRLQQGGTASRHAGGLSFAMPRLSWFGGVRAIVWKNLVVARRSRRELLMASGFTFVYTGFLVVLGWMMRRFASQGGDLGDTQMRDFSMGLVSMLAVLSFLLQRSLPFDFRRDGMHLLTYRTLPFGATGLALAELAVPVAGCLLFQAVGLVALMLVGNFAWATIILVVLAFPAIAFGLNGVWNAHYLLAATRRAGGKPQSASPMTLLMVVALSFLIFYPAGWLALEVGQHLRMKHSEVVGIGVWLVTQYAMDFVLILFLARLFQRFEISREA